MDGAGGALVGVVGDLVQLACELAHLRGLEEGAEAGQAVDVGHGLPVFAAQVLGGQLDGLHGARSWRTGLQRRQSHLSEGRPVPRQKVGRVML
ncbi:hypothetical protein IPC1286_14965 [Pseudomonas aeruginosa]|nr:hypothetical protein IPC1286_14965 [Pseudomonas aeruginosa]